MRISGGQFKGRRIAARKAFARTKADDELRPTSAKVREALFDILRADIANASFLDLYAGTGTVGFEALSRGAARISFVEDHPVRFRAIRETVERLGAAERVDVHRERAVDFLKKSSLAGGEFDIVFADPPYDSGEAQEIVPLVGSSGVLRSGGCLVVEHRTKLPLPEEAGRLRLVKGYRYGDTMLSLYRKEI